MRFGFNNIKIEKDILLIAIPFGYPDDATNRKILLNNTEPWISNPQERYTIKEFLLNGRRCGAEGWLLQGEEGGLLIAKYSPDMVEYSVIDSLDSVIRFGGVGIFRKDPEEAYLLPPKRRIEFGVTRYVFYSGDWKEGFYQFREYMSSMGHTFKRVDKEYQGCFRKDFRGKPYTLDYCWAICQGSARWKKEKLKRFKRLIEDGVEFLIFDFCLFDDDLENYRSCWDNSHGHKIPLTKNEHIKDLMGIIQEIKKEFPHVLIEAHDGLVGGRYSSYHPLYFRYNWPNSFDELWGFEK